MPNIVMEEIQTRHRKEQRDLQSRVTQKKKQASKKTRKAVNDECERLESELKERQAREIAALDGEDAGEEEQENIPTEQLEDLTLKVDGEDEQPSEAPISNGEQQQDHESVQPAKKRNRQKERLARRAAEQASLAETAAEEAQNQPDLKSLERTRMLSSMKQHNLHEQEIRADGHCLYSAIADQLTQLSIPLTNNPSSDAPPSYKVVRAKAADYISSHSSDYLPFLEEPLDSYLHKVRDTGEWGGQLELMALSKSYGVPINVLQDYGRVERFEAAAAEGGSTENKEEIWLGYYKHGFGLGEHYNSLRRKDTA